MACQNRCAMCLILVLLAAFACSSSSKAHQFVVGGKDGWTLNPKERYNHWAERMRFQVNDTLLFNYDKASDSVLVVNKTAYDECETDNPITKIDDSNPVFKFDRSGLFFFVSGNKTNCYQLQKMVILVMAVRNRLSNQTVPHHHGVVSPSSSPLASGPDPRGGDEPVDNNGSPHDHERSFGVRDSDVTRCALVVSVSVVSFVLGLGFVGWY